MVKTTRMPVGKSMYQRWAFGGLERSKSHEAYSRHLKAKGGPGTRVLVAEDDGYRREAIRQSLSKLGMRVRTVDNPYDILAEIGRFRPDVLFLDDCFSKSGIEYRDIILKLMGRFPGLRVVVTYPEGGPADYEGHDARTAPMTWGAIGSLSKDDMLRGDQVERSVRQAVGA